VTEQDGGDRAAVLFGHGIDVLFEDERS